MDHEKPPQIMNVQTLNLQPGLYMVATPIGNLRDVTLRALDVLSNADLILCEDTRVSQKFLKAWGIAKPCRAYHDHSDDAQRQQIISDIQAGQAVAMISDAGMPLISDPGYKLVRDCRAADLYVTTIPGANAPLSALQLSGLPSDRFGFIGFLPPRSGPRRSILERFAAADLTLLTFETGPRLVSALEDIADVLPGRDVAVVREITKLFEETRRAAPQELIAFYDESGAPKGEIVLVIAPPSPEAASEVQVRDKLEKALRSLKTKEAAKIVARETGWSVSDIYNLALALKK